MQKGSQNRPFRERVGVLQRTLKRYLPRRNNSPEERKMCRYVLEDLIDVRNGYNAYMDSLPQKFSKSYGEEDYERDKTNVRLYYSRWKKEDLWESKKSLKRLKRYEAREGLEHFADLEERERNALEMKKIEAKEDSYAAKARQPKRENQWMYI